MTAADRPPVTDNARAEAERRWPRLYGPEETLTYPREAVREHTRAGFMAGAEWAAGRAETTTDEDEVHPSGVSFRWEDSLGAETTTATIEDAARVMRDEWMQHGPEVTWLHMARTLDARGLLATARTLPTREQIARALREGRTNGLCKPGVRCDMCDCAQDYEDDLALRDADTVLTLLADHHTTTTTTDELGE